MKRTVFVFILALATLSAIAQKKSGTVYSEHEYIDKSKELWSAFINGDSEAMLGFLTDSVHVIINGNYTLRPKAFFAATAKWWSGVDHLKAVDDKPAYPDAIDYGDGGIWVQDWLRLTGIHHESGVNINVQVHNIYRFDENGLINTFYQYFDDSFFTEIQNSSKTTENGKVYINHPYITTVRKLTNAFASMDLDAWSEFFAPNARFSNNMTKYGVSFSLEEVRKYYEERQPQIEGMNMKQSGYPDCIYYAEGDYYVVMSWWQNTIKMKDGTIKEYPSMLTHKFNKDGKIDYARLYVSSNHLE